MMTYTFFEEDSIQSSKQLTLYQLNQKIRQTLERGLPEKYWVVAEVSSFSRHTNGHCYMELTDKDAVTGSPAQAKGTLWSKRAQSILPPFEAATGQRIHKGMKVLLQVSVRFHEQYGLALDVCDIDPNYTLGDIARRKQETLARLQKEGLLERNKTLTLARVPQRIAVISSATAAGYGDFIHQLENNPQGYSYKYTLFKAVVQGQDAPLSICAALQAITLQWRNFDAVVLIRGGGSQNDLNCFDEYEVAAAIGRMPLPVLTGIGHERDETIADLVAHTRLKTPTAVASFLLDRSSQLETDLETTHNSILALANRAIRGRIEDLDRATQAIHKTTAALLRQRKLKLAQAEGAIAATPRVYLARNNASIAALQKGIVAGTQKQLKSQESALDLTGQKLEGKSNIMLRKADQALDHHIHCISTGANEQLTRRNMSFARLTGKLKFAVKDWVHSAEHRLAMSDTKVKMLSPERQLRRGFSLTYIDGKLLRSVEQLKEGVQLSTQLVDGKIASTVNEVSAGKPGFMDASDKAL
jgi:exodeoxyribonuclease VII large subunit